MATSEGSRVTVTGRLSRYTEAPKKLTHGPVRRACRG